METSTKTPNFDLIKFLSQANDRQLDTTMTTILSQLDEQKTPEQVKEGLRYVLDMSAHGGLASQMVMIVLDGEWRRLGGQINDLTEDQLGKKPNWLV